MNTFKCKRRCFIGGRIYEVGDVLRANIDSMPHFELVKTEAVKASALRPAKAKKKHSKEKDLDILT